ncbi:MAG: hypothetical protein WBA23_14190 [Tunicatimonas sp.]|uniref:hypothetical protein n=1 Tax=Tunicatimonas sp. TaxID=1940096 RepID=UPI003C746BC4
MKITKREILGFILGILAYFAIDTVNWDQVKADAETGYNDGYNADQKSSSTTE